MVRSSYPLGFRFCPTDIELLKYYLKRKVLGKKFHSNVDFISTIDVYKYEPWDLPDIACPRNGDLKWYFFCPRDRKYGSGQRINRATEKGYWKTTGNARIVTFNDEVVGARRTLIFHMGRAPCGDRTDWVMHEYSLQEKDLTERGVVQDAYFLCEIYQKEGPGPRNGAQYGAPFIEEEWSDGEENIVGLDPFAGPSIPSSVLPSDPNRAVDSSSDASKMMCMGSVSFPLPSETALSINVVLPPLPKIDGILTNGSSAQIPQVADNELLPVLEHFSEEYNMVSTENNIQNVNFHTFEGNSEVLGSEGTGVNHHIAEMNNTDQLNNFGCDIRGGWGADHAPHHMFSSDAPFSFVELIDLPPRLDFPNENVNSEAFDVNSELLCPEEIGIYHHLATLDNMHQPNNFGSDICGGWTADHAPEQISSYDDPFSFMELDDLDKPFNFPAEVIGCSRTDGFYAEPELFSNYQQFYDSADSYRGVMHLPGPSDPSLLQPATSSGFQDPFFLEEDDGVGEILRDVHENSEAALSTVGEVSCNESEPGNKCAKQSSSRGSFHNPR